MMCNEYITCTDYNCKCNIYFKVIYSITSRPLLILLVPYASIMSLLFLHAELPFLCDQHVVVLKPDEVFTVAPVRWEH